MENKKLLEQSFIKWGLYLGLISIIITFTLYMIDVALMVSGWVSLITYALIVVFYVLSAKQEKSERGGYLTYGQAVINSLGVNVMYALISIIFTALLYNVIDQGLAEQIKEITLEKLASTFESMGMDQDAIDTAMASAEERSFDQDFRSLATAFLALVAINFVLGLIVSIFTRKNPPLFEAEEEA